MYEDVSSLLSANFEEEIRAVALRPLGVGQNRFRHLEVETTNGKRFGVKSTAGNAEYEAVVSLVARLVGAPNATRCVVERLNDVKGLDPLHNQTVAKIEWLPGRVGSLADAEVLRDITSNPEPFYEQYGEWCAVGQAMWVGDRDNPSNWVWAIGDARLQMIDFEYAFSADRASLQYARLLIRQDISLADRVKWAQNRVGYPEGLYHGFCAMRVKLRKSWKSIASVLEPVVSQNRIADNYKFIASDDSHAFSEITAAI